MAGRGVVALFLLPIALGQRGSVRAWGLFGIATTLAILMVPGIGQRHAALKRRPLYSVILGATFIAVIVALGGTGHDSAASFAVGIFIGVWVDLYVERSLTWISRMRSHGTNG